MTEDARNTVSHRGKRVAAGVAALMLMTGALAACGTTASTPESERADTPTPLEQPAEAATEPAAPLLFSFEFENYDGYRFAVELNEFDVGAVVDIANARPGEADIETNPTIEATFTNLLPNKNFEGGVGAVWLNSQLIHVFPLYLSATSVCEYSRANESSSTQRLSDALADVGYCTLRPGAPSLSSSLSIGIPSLSGGESKVVRQGAAPEIEPGAAAQAFSVDEDQADQFAQELADPAGFIITNWVLTTDEHWCRPFDEGFDDAFAIAYSSVELGCE